MLVKVQFETDASAGKERYYTYYSVGDMALGDLVTVPTRDGLKTVKVVAINVPGAEIQKFKGQIKTIPAGSVIGKAVVEDKYGLEEPIGPIRLEAANATAYHIKRSGKSLFSQGREGKLYLIDKIPYVLVEDNGTRGVFRPVGKKVANLLFKPLSTFSFENITEII